MISWNQLCMPKCNGGLGIKRMRQMNDACFLKIGRRMLHEKYALWTKVLSGKYGRNTILEANVISKPTDSFLWKDLSKLWPKLSENCSWALNNGMSIRFWEDNWMKNMGRLKGHALAEISEANLSKKVVDYVGEDGDWNWNSLSILLPPNIISRFHSTLPPSRDMEQDTWVWNHDKSGRYTVKSAYELLAGDMDRTLDPKWLSIWHMDDGA